MDDFPGPGEMVDGSGGFGFDPGGGFLAGGGLGGDPTGTGDGSGAGSGSATGGDAFGDPASKAGAPAVPAANAGTSALAGGPAAALGRNFSNAALYTVEGVTGVRDVNEVY